MNETKLYETDLVCRRGTRPRYSYIITKHRIYSKDHRGFYRVVCVGKECGCGKTRYSTHPHELKAELTQDEIIKQKAQQMRLERKAELRKLRGEKQND